MTILRRYWIVGLFPSTHWEDKFKITDATLHVQHGFPKQMQLYKLDISP